jgi:hypothetical protein
MGKSGNVSPLEEQSAMGIGHITGENSAPFQGHLPDAAARSGKGRGDFVTLDKEVGVCLWQAPESTQPCAWEVGDEKVNLNGRVYLEGEIPLAHDIQPSCACPIFCVEVPMFFFEFEAKDFLTDGLDSILLNCYPSTSPDMASLCIQEICRIRIRIPTLELEGFSWSSL